MKLRFRLVPTDDTFFELFEDSATNSVECAQRLRSMLDDLHAREAAHSRVVECERRGDQITRDILRRLNSTFVTPFDREDIHALAEELDDVVDDMLAVSHLLLIVPPDSPLPELKEQADLLVQMSEQSSKLVSLLRPMKGIEPCLEAVDRLESEGDAVYRRILARFMSGEFDALTVLRWKDIVEAMEAAMNTVEDISNVVESIVLKHA
jgi:predicted phosphate transport protein (TIGR00153 family)